MSFAEQTNNFFYPYTIRVITSFLFVLLLVNNWSWIFWIFIQSVVFFHVILPSLHRLESPSLVQISSDGLCIP
jgi:hypothetical protein